MYVYKHAMNMHKIPVLASYCIQVSSLSLSPLGTWREGYIGLMEQGVTIFIITYMI